MNNRPLKMLHGYDFGSAKDDSFDAKKQVIEQKIDDLHRKGYGGIVTNVNMDQKYLQDEESWQLFRHAVQYAAAKYHMVIWLYDEKGYPSGSAGGLTLQENPDYECKGLVMLAEDAAAGAQIEIRKPRGHMNIQAVYAVDRKAQIQDLQKYVAADGTLRFQAQSACRVYYFITKRLYEGTHAQHNTCASRRYISLTNPDAVAAFIRNTYQAYTAHLQDLCLPEGAVQAFFTDEPSHQACYINKGLDPQVIDDPIDQELPLYPVVSWEAGIFEKYQEKYGESVLHRLHHLFEGITRASKITRYRYFVLLSDLYEESFFQQISAFCEAHGIAFSGHLLLEENLLHHALFEGNYFQLLRHMHIPGIDMLFTKPERILQFAETPKLVASVASWYGRKHVMSEISAHTENAFGIPFTIQEIICAQLLQFALGVDIFNSYFDDTALSLEENKMLCDTVANAVAEFSGKRSMADVILYYPIESAQASLKGSDKQLYDRPYDDDATACEESWRGTIDLLLRNNYMFDCADESALSGAVLLPEECCIWNPVSNLKYHALIVPKLAAVTMGALERFQMIADCGIPVILQALSPDITVLDAGCAEAGSSAVIRLLSSENVVNANTVHDALECLQYLLPPDIALSGGDGLVLSLAKQDDAGKISYIAVNAAETPKTITISADIRTQIPKAVSCMNPADGIWREIPVAPAPGERFSAAVELPALEARIIKF